MDVCEVHANHRKLRERERDVWRRVGCNMWQAGGGFFGEKVFALGKQILINGGNVVPQQYYNLNPGSVWLQPATTQVGQPNPSV